MPIGSLIGGIISGNGAAAAGQGAMNASNGLNVTNSAGFSPYMMTGPAANSQLSALLGQGYLRYDGNGQYGGTFGESFNASPSYNFRLQQGQNALSNSAAARGMSLSGAQAKALTDYNQNSASQEYQNWLNNYTGLANNAVGSYMNTLGSLSGQGLQAAGASASARNAAMIPGIQANAQGQAAQAASLGNGIGGAINSLGSLATFGAAGGFGKLFGSGVTGGVGSSAFNNMVGSAYDSPLSGWR